MASQPTDSPNISHPQHVASAPDCSVWVSANAGTGKTHTLTSRILRLLLAGAAPDSILCLTYTHNAATEMQERLRKRLRDWTVSGDTDLHASLAKLLGEEPDSATLAKARTLFATLMDHKVGVRILTIHSFCQSVLKAFPLEAGIPPHFELLDERTQKTLLHEAKQRLLSLEGADERVRESLYLLAQQFPDMSFAGLLKELMSKRRKLAAHFANKEAPRVLLENVRVVLGVDSEANEQNVFAECFGYLPATEASLRAAIPLLAAADTDGANQLAEGLALWLEKPIRDEDAAAHYVMCWLTQAGEIRKNIGGATLRKKRPDVAELLDAEAARAQNYATQMKALETASLSEAVIHLTENFFAHYQALKLQRGVLDFDDLILHTNQLLQTDGIADWVRYQMDSRTEHLLVDEAQDTSHEQWLITKSITDDFFSGETGHSKRTLFVVGDEKQSIFSFQGAAPHVFDVVRNGYGRVLENIGDVLHEVALQASFRSTPPILRVVDAVCSSPHMNMGGFVEPQAHLPTRAGQGGVVEVWPLQPKLQKDVLEPWHIATTYEQTDVAVQRLADQVAETVAGWLIDGRNLAGHHRPVRAGDILILVGKRHPFAETFSKALMHKGVPVAGLDRLLLTDHIVIQDMLALAQFVALPADDLNLACLLKSPLMGLGEEALFELCHNRGEASLWEVIQQRSADANISKIHQSLKRWLELSAQKSPYAFFHEVLEKEGARGACIARLGAEVDDLLNEFLAQAMQFESVNVPSMQMFLHWMQTGDETLKRDMDASVNHVRIMTVHGAKGLQAPIVILPDTTAMPEAKGQRIFFEEIDGRNTLICAPTGKTQHEWVVELKEHYKQRQLEEDHRLLYVALTRAEDELYVCGVEPRGQAKPECWYELVKQAVQAVPEAVVSEDGGVRYVTQSHVIPAQAGIQPHTQLDTGLRRCDPPTFLGKPLPEESISILTPSSFLEMAEPSAAPKENTSNRKARERGVLVHKLLQWLPELGKVDAQAVTRFLNQDASGFSEKECAQLTEQVMAVLHHPEFAAIFAAGSVAEAPIIGQLRDANGETHRFHGQIDRLCVTEKAVLVVDYKTGGHVPETVAEAPKAYLAQMYLYARLLAEQFRGKEIYTALLWTAEPSLMLLPMPELLANLPEGLTRRFPMPI